MGRFRSKAGAKKGAGDCCAVQTGHPAGQPFCSWQSYGAVTADAALYRNLRENIPILDAAIGKLVRLTGGFSLDTGSDGLNAQLNRDLSGINVGGNQQGIEAFIATYLDQLLTYGSAVGEMITATPAIWKCAAPRMGWICVFSAAESRCPGRSCCSTPC